jgi:hypothetical protein
MKEMLGVEVEASPIHRSFRRALQQVARRVAEELGDVDLLDLAFGLLSRAPTDAGGVACETLEEIVEQAASAETAFGSRRQAAFGEVDLTQVFGLGRLSGPRYLDCRNCRPDPANVAHTRAHRRTSRWDLVRKNYPSPDWTNLPGRPLSES